MTKTMGLLILSVASCNPPGGASEPAPAYDDPRIAAVLQLVQADPDGWTKADLDFGGGSCSWRHDGARVSVRLYDAARLGKWLSINGTIFGDDVPEVRRALLQLEADRMRKAVPVLPLPVVPYLTIPPPEPAEQVQRWEGTL